MATKTKTMLLDEIEAKNLEIKLLKEEVKKVERYKQYEEAAGEMAALRDSFINAGFTKAEANDLLKLALTNAMVNNGYSLYKSASSYRPR